MRAGARSFLLITVAIPNVSDNVNTVEARGNYVGSGWAVQGEVRGGLNTPSFWSGNRGDLPSDGIGCRLDFGLRRLLRNWLKLAHAAGNVSLAVDLRLGVNFLRGGGSGEIRLLKAGMTKIPNKIRHINLQKRLLDVGSVRQMPRNRK
jgi:hypothetical protein